MDGATFALASAVIYISTELELSSIYNIYIRSSSRSSSSSNKMGKKQHQKDKLYITATEWREQISCLLFNCLTNGQLTVKSDFLKLSPPWVTREFLFARRNLVFALTPLFLGQFGQTKVLRTPVGILFWLSRLCFSVNLVKPKFYGLPKLCSFPVIIGFLPKSFSADKRKFT
eukprot:sb/3472143/